MTDVAFYHSDKPREVQLANAFAEGVRVHGDQVELRRLGPNMPIGDCDLACMVGVKSRNLWRKTIAAGVRPLMLDKGYSRHKVAGGAWEYWRLSLDAHHPTGTTLMRFDMPGDRLDRLDWRVRPWTTSPEVVIFAGSSEKYHRFYDLPHPTAYAKSICKRIRAKTSLPIIYRPKPSWRDAAPIHGTIFSPGKESLAERFRFASCLVTHGSNACVDAMLAGVPAVTLGDGVAAALGNRSIDDVGRPGHPDISQWLANLAYHQFTESEMALGTAWGMVRRWMHED